MWSALRAWSIILLASGSGIGAAQVKIPTIQSVTLSGEKIALPQDLAGRPVVLIVGFSQGSREQATAWGKRLAAEAHDGAAPRYYEMPVLASVPRLLRGLVLRKIASELSDAAKQHFLPVYEHEPEWRTVAGYGKGGDAYVLLVDGAGVVRWRCEGAVDDAHDAELKRQVAELLGL